MRSKLSVVLLASALVSLAAALALGLRALYADVEGARSRYAERAADAARTVAAAIEAVRTSGEGALELAANAEGSLEPLASDGARAAPESDGGTRRYVERDLDALELEGRGAEVLERLRKIAGEQDDPDLAAWALTALGARSAAEGRLEEAREAWTRLAGEFPQARDDRGLLRAHAARFELARAFGAASEELAGLLDELDGDRRALDDAAVAVLAEQVAAMLRETAPQLYEEREPERRRRVRELRLRATWPTGISDWLAQGAPGDAQVFDLANDPLAPTRAVARVLVTARRDGERWICRAIELGSLAAAALARPEAATWRDLGFDAAVEGANGVVLAGVPAPADAPSAAERVAPPLSELSVRSFGRDFAGFVAGERRRFRLVGALAIGAFLAASAAALATLKAVRREARLAREREAFVAAVTHELKTPLASIRLFAELLEQGDVEPAKVREFGARTVVESDRLSRLVDGVLRFAKQESATSNAAERPRVDLHEVAEAAAASVTLVARERGFEVEIAAPEEPVTVRGDRDALVGAVAELVDNATKYGGAPHAIRVEIERRGELSVVSVLDRGPGVKAEDRTRIFGAFQRLGDEMTRERPGVGLGLALVRAVARSHGGEATFAPRDGGGSRFEIALPGSGAGEAAEGRLGA